MITPEKNKHYSKNSIVSLIILLVAATVAIKFHVGVVASLTKNRMGVLFFFSRALSPKKNLTNQPTNKEQTHVHERLRFYYTLKCIPPQ